MAKRVRATTILGFLLVAACGQGAPPGQPGELAPSPTVDPTTEPSPMPSATSSGTGSGLLLVATTVENLSLRMSPGTGSERIGLLRLGTLGVVLAGPVEAEGMPWYQLTGMGLSWASGCLAPEPDQPVADQPIDCPGWGGWVAGADPAGTAWLEPAAPSCPSPPITIETISQTQWTLHVVCWSGQDLTFRAWWPAAPPDAPICDASDPAIGWLLCENLRYNALAANEAEGQSPRLYLSIDPRSGVVMPARGQWVQVVGHFDDPAAAQCAERAPAGDLEPAATVFFCRTHFVPTSVTAVAGR